MKLSPNLYIYLLLSSLPVRGAWVEMLNALPFVM